MTKASALSRRAALGAFAGAAVAPLASCEGSPAIARDAPLAGLPDPDEALYQLGYRLLVASVGYNEPESDEEFQQNVDRAGAIVEEIIDIPAKTISGLRVKALALRCANGFGPIDMAASFGDAMDARVLASIVDDLLAC
jgi:hypothetical protein